MTTTTKIAGEAMTNEQIIEIAAQHVTPDGWMHGELIMSFARALLESKPAVPQGFDEWMANPYTKTLMKSIESDYVPKPAAPASSAGDQS